MKTFRFIAACAALFAVGCSQFQDADEKVSISTTHQRYYASLDEETKTYVEENKYLRWHAEDEISVFPTHTTNVRYQFEGETGDKSGSFKTLEADAVTGTPLNYTYAVYPYNSTNSISEEGVLSVTLPAMQLYNKHSFGKGANTEVAVSESAVSDKLFFKNACGYLKLRLYGESQEIKSVTLRGNNSEKISGAATITATFEGVPEVVMGEGATTDVVIICEEGVVLGATAEEATEFWFVLPPMTFEKGFTVYVSGEVREMKQSTSNSVTIERNQILPMQTLKVEPNITIANRKIYYTSSDGNIVTPRVGKDYFGANIISNTYENGQGVITFDGEVTKIGGSAFSNCSNLASVTIPEGVTSIESRAFRSCSRLTSVTIPEGVTSIGYEVFSGCSSLKSVTIPDSVTEIESFAFSGCSSLTSVNIPESVSYIGESAFSYCSSLTSVVIPDGITEIKEDTFQKCTSLKSVTIPASVTEIENYAFYKCNNLTEVHITDLSSWCEIKYSGVYNYGKGPLYYAKNLYLNGKLVEGDLVIPDGTSIIGIYAFYGCSAITSVTIPDSVKVIGYEAFCECTSLKSATIGNGVTSIEYGAFNSCSSLKSVTLGDGVTSIGQSAFSWTSLESITIPDSVERIYDYAFSTCKNLTKATIGATTLGQKVFQDCENLKDVTFTDGTNSIGDYTFYNCTSLANVTFGNNITSIGLRAFDHCSSLTSVTIPDSVTSIRGMTFTSCTSLTSVKLPKNLSVIPYRMFYACSSLTSIAIPDSVTSIEDSAFGYCTSLTRVDITDLSAWYKIDFDNSSGANPLNNGAKLYLNGSELTKITIPADITEIKPYVFYNYTSLTDVYIHDNVTSIGTNAFYGCTSLTSVTIPDGIASIESSTFSGCTSLTSITIPDSVTKIGSGAFYKCTSLDGEIIIPEGVTSIGEEAFYMCSGIDKVVIPSTVTSFGLYTFSGCNCEAVIKCNIPDRIKIYGNSFRGVFSGNTFHKVTITEGVTTIGSEAFYDNDILSEIVFPESLTTIREDAFYNCSILKSVIIPKNVTEICARAFYYCTKLFAVRCEPTTPPTLGKDAFACAKSSLIIHVPSRETYLADPEWAKYDVCLVDDLSLIEY